MDPSDLSADLGQHDALDLLHTIYDDPNATSTTRHQYVTCTEIAAYCYHTFYNVSIDVMEDCFLNFCFEPRSMRPVYLYPLTAIYLLIFVIGVIGNVTTCIIMKTAGKYANTSTSRYLSNLALADLIGLLSGVPFEIYLGWNQYPWHPPDFVCHIKAWLLETTSYVSILTIVAFSLERYVAICHSLRANSKLIEYRRRIGFVLTSLWLIAGVCAAPYSFYHRADYTVKEGLFPNDYGPIRRTKMCMLALAFDPTLKTTFQFLFHASAILFFFMPLAFLVFLYVRMALVIRKTRKDLRSFHKDSQASLASNVALAILKGSNEVTALITPNSSSHSHSYTHFSNGNGGGTQDYGSRKIFYMLAAVVVSFFLCYAPYQLQRLLFFYMDDSSSHQTVNTYLYLISGVLFYLSSILNPILYSVMSLRFRNAFGDILCCCGKHSSSAKRLRYSNILNGENYSLVIRRRRPIRPPQTINGHG